MDETLERKSKSQVKREMLALQSLGERLVKLSTDQLNKIEMPDELKEAVRFAGTLKKHEAWRRHMQYLGVLMRDVDPEPIQKALEALERGRSLDARRFQEIEQWRDELVNGNERIMEAIVHQFPNADRQRLRQLSSNARREKDAQKPPKSSRALFRYLRELSDHAAKQQGTNQEGAPDE